MQSQPLSILVIVGTVRQGRLGRTLADWYLQQARKLAPHITFDLFDLAEHNLPTFNEAAPPRTQRYSELQQTLAQRIAAADGFIFITGEYNHSVPGSLKNFLDYLYHEWDHKPAAYVGYGTHGGVRAIEHLVQIMAELGVASVKGPVTIMAPWMAVSEDGAIRPEFVHGNIAHQLTELTWWAQALKTASAEKVTI